MTERIFQKRSGLFKIGIISAIFWSLVIGVLNIGVLYLFGIPIIGLLLGIVFVWFSKESIKEKLIVTFIPIPIILVSFFIVLQLSKAEPETFLIPKSFRGKIIVFYEEPCGQTPVFENGRRIYQFHENGILITNFKKTEGILDQEFYFVDENGSRVPVPKLDVRDFNFKGRLSNTDSEPSRDLIGAFWANSHLLMIPNKSHSYIISNYHYFEKGEKEKWLEEKQFTETVENLLKECRQR